MHEEATVRRRVERSEASLSNSSAASIRSDSAGLSIQHSVLSTFWGRLCARAHRTGLLQRLTVLVVAGFTLFLGTLAVLTGMAARETRMRIERSLLPVAQMAAADIDRDIDHAFNELTSMAALLPAADPDGTRNSLGSLGSLYVQSVLGHFETRPIEFSHGIILTDTSGSVTVARGSGAPPLGTDLSRLAHVQAALSGTDRSISNAYPDPLTGRPVVAFAVPQRSLSGAISGALIGEVALDTEQFVPAIESARQLGGSGHASVIDRQLRVLASTEGDPVLGPGEHPDLYEKLWRQASMAVGSGPTIDPKQGGTQNNNMLPDHIMAFAPLRMAPWAVALGGDVEETLAPVTWLERRMIAFGVGSALLAVIGTLFVALQLVRPVDELSRTAQRMAAGDLEVPVTVPAGGEIGLLATNLETMRARLRDHLQAAQAWGHELEERVDERTRELTQRNRELTATLDVAATVNRAADTDRLLKLALDRFIEIAGADAGTVWLFDPNDHKLSLQGQRNLPKRLLAEAELACKECQLVQPEPGGHPLVATDLATRTGSHSLCTRAGFRGLVVMPLATRQAGFGALHLYFRSPEAAGVADLRLLTGIGQQISVGLAKARLHEEVEALAATRGQLLRYIVAAQEEERKRIARELHDDTIQALTALLMHLDALEVSGSAPSLQPPAPGPRVARAKELVTYTLDGVRAIVRDLRPNLLDDLGLVPAIHWYAERHLELGGASVTVDISPRQDRLAPEVEMTLFRTIQEALNNVAKHAHAQHVRIGLTFDRKRVVATVEDDGQGFDLAAVRQWRTFRHENTPAFGLTGMEERVALIGGTLDIRTSPGHGTRVRIEIPASPVGPTPAVAGARNRKATVKNESTCELASGPQSSVLIPHASSVIPEPVSKEISAQCP